MATEDVSIVVLTNQKARRVPVTRNTFYGMICILAKVRGLHSVMLNDTKLRGVI